MGLEKKENLVVNSSRDVYHYFVRDHLERFDGYSSLSFQLPLEGFCLDHYDDHYDDVRIHQSWSFLNVSTSYMRLLRFEDKMA